MVLVVGLRLSDAGRTVVWEAVMSTDLQEELSEADMSDEWKICKNGGR